MIRFPTLENTLRFLVGAGLDIGTVLDVGVHTGSAALQAVFANKKHILFEPVSECHERLEKNYAKIDHELIKAAVSDYDGIGYLDKYSIDESGEIFCCLVGEAETAEMNPVPSIKLDSFFQNRNSDKPYLIKIAVDGHEMSVLRGAQEVLRDAAALIANAFPCNIDELLNFMKPRGFQLYDMVDNTYYFGNLHWFDLVFLPDALVEKLAAPAGPVAWDQWVPVADFDPNRRRTGASDGAAQAPAGAEEWLPLLHLSPVGERVVRARPGQAGCVFFGPYRPLPSGRYRARLRLKLVLPWTVRYRMGSAGKKPVARLDVTTAHGTICLAERPLFRENLGTGDYVLDFTVSESLGRTGATIEVRMWTQGAVSVEISSVTVAPIAEATEAKAPSAAPDQPARAVSR
ncbi:MAG: FkbM family methyltransferase [Stellaceae bacterium]